MLVLAARLAALRPSVVVVKLSRETRQASTLLLPFLGGGHEGGGHRGGSSGEAQKTDGGGLRSPSRRGFAYPGPQSIISNPPLAVIGTQTILQRVKNLPQLHHEIVLPNLVRPASVDVADRKTVIKIKSGGLVLRQTEQKAINAPKLKLPVKDGTPVLLALADSKPVVPTRAGSDPADPVEPKMVDHREKGLLVLNAIPPPPDLGLKVPRAERRSLFAVTPGEVTTIADPATGTKAEGEDSSGAGNGGLRDIARGDTLAEPMPADTYKNTIYSSGSGSGSGSGVGNSSGSGFNSDPGANGKGRGSSSGPGLGSAESSGAGTGAGEGSAPGLGGFRGITIQGGRYGNGKDGSLVVKKPSPPQDSYSMTIVSTSRGGGGLPDLGVFHNEKVYTVYLDMRANQDDPAPSWTLQYAVLPGTTSDAADQRLIQGTPTPPYAMLKEIPDFDPDLLRKYSRRLIVASAILDEGGRLEKLSIIQSPANEFAAPLLDALQHWMFQPALLDGHPIALKVLLGIRFAARPVG